MPNRDIEIVDFSRSRHHTLRPPRFGVLSGPGPRWHAPDSCSPFLHHPN